MWGHTDISEEDEDLLDVTFDALHLLSDHVESHGLGEWSALADSHDISDVETEGWGAVSRDGVMALLKSVVLFNVVKIIAADDNIVLHLSGDDNTPVIKHNNY